MFEKVGDVLLDSLIDTLKVLPILLLVYILIELIEVKFANKWHNFNFLNNKFSPLIAGAVGIIPQCGFSIVATDLYCENRINIGTLLAVYIATSDEAIPYLLGESYNPNNLKYILLLIGIKLIYAVLIGYLANMIFKKINTAKLTKLSVIAANNIVEDNLQKVDNVAVDCDDTSTINDSEHMHNESDKDHILAEHHKEGKVDLGCCGHHIIEEKTTFKTYFLHPLIHSLKICAFILVINIVLGLLLEFVGFENLSNVLLNNSIFQPFVMGLIGLIPNCAASVLITNLFANFGINFASCLAGLCTNAGVAIVVLFKNNKNIKENLVIVSFLYVVSSLLGFVLQFLF